MFIMDDVASRIFFYSTPIYDELENIHYIAFRVIRYKTNDGGRIIANVKETVKIRHSEINHDHDETAQKHNGTYFRSKVGAHIIVGSKL